jgi:uncharacterized repeat protein (TIGR03803 family)
VRLAKRMQFRSFAIDNQENPLALVTALAIAFVVAFVAVPVTQAQTFSVIYTFGSGEGSHPVGGVTIRAGQLFGTTAGGVDQYGSVYQLSHLGSGWSAKPLALFFLDGEGPIGNADFGPDGHLYSTTQLGGAHNAGALFNLVPPVSFCKTAECLWTENVVHDFQFAPDGAYPTRGSLIWDQQGNLFGTTSGGGYFGWGTIFEVTKSLDSWTETPLHSFSDGYDGAAPQNGVVFDSHGNLFGTATTAGGSCRYQGGCGTLFELFPYAGGWEISILHTFSGDSDGAYPAGVIFDMAGNLYGATQTGGSGSAGTIYELSPSGNTWTFNVLYTFSGLEGCGSIASLSLDAAGNLYGTTVCGGAYQWGSVFKLTNTANGWVYTSLHDFTGGVDGAYPECNVTIDSDGTIYGTARFGGSGHDNAGNGVVWMITP